MNHINKLVKVDNGLYKCIKCDNTFDRRFNGIRHFERFHVIVNKKTCCGNTFFTKGDFYDHRAQIHNDVKRYGRQWKKNLNLSKQNIKQAVEASAQPQQPDPAEQQNEAKNLAVPSNSRDTLDSTTSRRKKNKHPKRHPSYCHRIPLRSIENLNNNNNNAMQNNVGASTSSENVAKEEDKFHIYKFNVKTEAELKKALNSIIF